MLELLITLAIVALLLGIAAANFSPMIERTYVRETASLLKADIDLARGESIVRGGWVALCGSADGLSCQDSYNDGWVVFQDVDQTLSLSSADTILNQAQQNHSTLSVVIDEVANDGAGPIYFNFKGIPSRAIRFTPKIGNTENGIQLAANGVVEKND